MKELRITTTIKSLSFEELSTEDRKLIEAAKKATQNSYSPYSKFSVGAAARLTDGTVVTGSNQENAAYPSGICAERTTLFYANSQYPDKAIEAIAVAACTSNGFIAHPIPPCGACRQVMLETEKRYKRPFRVLLYGENEICELERAADLLPLSFDEEYMK